MIKKSVECFGGVDILVANAGMCHVSEFLDLKLEDFEKVIRTNLCGTFLSGQAAAKVMVVQNELTPGRGGAIITMSSVNAEMAIGTTSSCTSRLLENSEAHLGSTATIMMQKEKRVPIVHAYLADRRLTRGVPDH